MNGFKRQVSPGAAAFIVVLVLALVQWVWWRGLIYKPPVRSAGRPAGGPPPPAMNVTITGHDYVQVDTIAGDTQPGYADGPGYMSRFDRPTGIAVSEAGVLYVCDTGNHRIRVVAADGSVSTLAGGEQGFADGPTSQARFNAPCGICTSPDGDIYVADTGNGRIRRIRAGIVTTLGDESIQTKSTSSPLAVEFQSTHGPRIVVLDGIRKEISFLDLNGKPISAPVRTVSLSLPGGGALHAGADASRGISIDGTDEIPDPARRPMLKQLIGECQIGAGALVTDAQFGAVFYIKGKTAEVFAGMIDNDQRMKGWRDGTGEKAEFGNLSCITTDGAKYAYVADTSNNCIRRISLPGFMFH